MKRNKPLMKIIWLLPLVFALCPARLAFAVDISVSVDRNPVNLEESFKIYFMTTDEPGGEPDFSPLEQDFSVLNQSQSTSSSWDNGNYTKAVRWTVEAIAKKSGKLTIPAITFGSDTSQPLEIDVTQGNAADSEATAGQDIFLQVKAEPERPFVQEQVIYTVRLYRRVDIAQASLSEPDLADAVIEKLGDDSNYNSVVNGVSYLVTERKYAIFPQKSGLINIKPLALTAEVILNGQRSFGDFFGSPMTKTKRVLSQELMLNVKPIPPGFTGKHWLPLENLELKQEWSGDIQKLKTGEPITRTLTLTGKGATAGQLPELNNLSTGANIKAYPDQPVLNEQKLAEGITATRQEKIALIPATGGKQVLPALEIPWFNTKTQAMEIARIPEATINVTGGNEIQPAPPPVSTSRSQQQPEKAVPKPETALQTVGGKEAYADNLWLWTSLFLGLGWLSTLAYFVIKQRPSGNDDRKTAEQAQREIRPKEITKQLKEACNHNDAQAVKDILLAWGKQTYNVNSMGTIANHCEARLRDEILALNRTLYGKEADAWNGKKLFQAYSENSARAKISRTEEDALEPLHRL